MLEAHILSVLEMIGVTVISMIIIKILERSNVLNLLLFGKKYTCLF